MLTVSLPYPPSANAIWRNVAGKTLKSEPYRKWISAAFANAVEQGVGTLRRQKIPGRYSLTILADRPDNRHRDLDNLAKPISDLLKTVGAIEDDHLAQRITLAWSNKPPGKGARIWITLESARAPD